MDKEEHEIGSGPVQLVLFYFSSSKTFSSLFFPNTKDQFGAQQFVITHSFIFFSFLPLSRLSEYKKNLI
jgi:hypothetical protein